MLLDLTVEKDDDGYHVLHSFCLGSIAPMRIFASSFQSRLRACRLDIASLWQ